MQKKHANKARLLKYKDDFQLFRDAVKDIKPLKHDKVIHPIKKNIQHSKGFELPKQKTSVDILSDETKIENINSLDQLSYCSMGVQKKVFKKLRQGRYIISDELDLHGLNVKQAKKLLLHFLEITIQIKGSCVIIIHGKGHRSNNKKPIIKQQTNHWLKQHPRVLAFHSAQPKDGGTGAVYVLLRQTPFNRIKS